ALTGFAALLLVAILGSVGVADGSALFAGAATTGLLGTVWALLAVVDAVSTVESAALVAAVTLIFSPLFGPLSIRLGRLPMPVLPRTSADLVRDDPQPPRSAVYAAVLRADGLLTGMIAGGCLCAALCQVLLALDGSTSAIILLFLLTIGFLLRARLYPAIRQRIPILCAGLAGASSLALVPMMAEEGRLLTVAVPILVVAAAGVMLLGLLYSTQRPGAYFGRYAEVLEVIVVLFCVPVTCSVLGLFGWVRGLGG
ncbi:MAG: type VII secretion integral membrane protein EccD, partial [Thermocrispum sp.]